MIRKNKWKLIISSVITLLPCLFSIFGKKLLPDKIAIHWGLDGQADVWSSAFSAFLILPVILLAVHWLCHILSPLVNKNREQNKKITEMTFWVIPAISIFSCAVIFTTSLGYSENIFTFSYLLFAVLFLYIGNYMPKTTRNVTIGIKIKWTIANDENWAATHRLGGKLFFAAGIVMLLGIFLPNSFFLYFLLSVILMITLIPFIYSYCFYKKQLKEGRATKEEYEKSYASLFKGRKPASAISAVLIVLVVVIVIVVLFTGSIETTVGDTALTVEASFWNDLVLDYDDISSIEYREDGISGIRINGFGSPKLSIGIFQNKEIGAHTRYTFNKITPNIIIKTETNIIVINCENEQETKELYNAILEKTSD